MKKTKPELILAIILGILLIIMVIVLMVKPKSNKDVIQTGAEMTTSEQGQTSKQKEIIQKSREEELKNASMHSGKVLCQIGEQIIYYKDTNKTIYQFKEGETQGKKLATLKTGAEKIYFDGESVYAIPSYYSGKGIYRIDLAGKVTTIYSGAALQLWLTQDSIYFVKQIGYDTINQNPQGTLCKMNKDGSGVVELAKSVKNYFFLQNDKIYYTTQNREMYVISQDGSNPEKLAEGRKFALNVEDNYLLYIDYADQESEHILSLTDKTDTAIGHFGLVYHFMGNTYVNLRKKPENGNLEDDYTLVQIDQNGKVKELGKILTPQDTLCYVIEGKAYINNGQEGMRIVDLATKQKIDKDGLTASSFYLGGYGYTVQSSKEAEIELKKVDLLVE